MTNCKAAVIADSSYVEMAFRSNENKKEVQSELSQKGKWNRAIPVVLRQLMCAKKVKEVLATDVNQKM